MCVCVHTHLLNHVQLFVTSWTVAHQASLSMEFSRQENWGGLPFPSSRDLPNPGIKLMSPVSPSLANPPTHRKRQGVRLLHSGSLASSQPLNTSTAQYSLLSGKLWVTCWPYGNLTSEDYPATPASATVTYICHPFIHFPHSYHTSLSMYICPVNSSLKGMKCCIL